VDCNDVLQQLSDYLDEEAREELCRQIEGHLSQCHDCQVYVDTVKKTIVLYQSDRKIEVPVTVASRLETALAQEYRNTSRPTD
jgi:predicted anti-sigma-YlaC factor YlaD